jgi:hypothetical protein
MLPVTIELDSCSGDEVFHGPGDHDLPRSRQRCDPGGNVDREPSQIVASDLAFPTVQADPDLETKWRQRLGHGLRATDRPRRPIEGHNETVSGGIDLAAAIVPQLRADNPVMAIEDAPPRLVSDVGQLRR